MPTMQARFGLVGLPNGLGERGREGVARLVSLFAQRFRQFGKRFDRRLAVDGNDERELVDRGNGSDFLCYIDWRRLQKIGVDGGCRSTADKDCVTIGCGARDDGQRQQATPARPIFHDDDVAGLLADLVGKKADHDVGAATRRKSADEM